MWKFDGTNWTWIYGSNVSNEEGNYGIKGVLHKDNLPPGRRLGVSWIDSFNNLYFFGGVNAEGN